MENNVRNDVSGQQIQVNLINKSRDVQKLTTADLLDSTIQKLKNNGQVTNILDVVA
jgi:hypothetical protein